MNCSITLKNQFKKSNLLQNVNTDLYEIKVEVWFSYVRNVIRVVKSIKLIVILGGCH